MAGRKTKRKSTKLKVKKGGKKKPTNPFAKKDWYNIKATSIFTTRNVVNRQKVKEMVNRLIAEMSKVQIDDEQAGHRSHEI